MKSAEEDIDYSPLKETVVFNHGEREKMISIQIMSEKPKNIESKTLDEKFNEDEISNDEGEGEVPDKMFRIVLEKPQPEGVHISRKNIAFVTIIESQESKEVEDNSRLIQFFMSSKNPSWTH